MTEEEHQIALFKMIKLHEGRYPKLSWVFHVPNGGYSGLSGKAKRAKLVRMGMRAGVPDVFVDVPKYKFDAGGRYISCPGLRIELKTEKGRITPEQRVWIEHYQKHGYWAEICRGWIEAWNVICDYLGYGELKQ